MSRRVLARISTKDLSFHSCNCGRVRRNGCLLNEIHCMKNVPKRTLMDVHDAPSKFKNAPRTKPLVRPASISLNIFLSTIPFWTIGIAYWQYQRKREIAELRGRIETQTSKHPSPVSKLLDEPDQRKSEFTYVELEGEFDNDREVYIGYRANVKPELTPDGSKWQKGVLVVTPFKLKDTGDVVLVNRGWVPLQWTSPTKTTAKQATGVVKITGLSRASERKNPFDFRPTQDSLNKKFFSHLDVDTIAHFLKTKPVFVDADLESSIPGGPIGGQTKIMHYNSIRDLSLSFLMITAVFGLFWFTQIHPQRAAQKYVKLYYANKQHIVTNIK
ncbi:surfeit locus protein 1-like [Saccostrea echinata]|uniref:surfeit locus protein 1-like n=1 Tax=Saccostrea echinata TaxID=191078 RepID=UPI002A80DB84|nr:surfeit locus protein 1-like [Saccostrea echinata]